MRRNVPDEDLISVLSTLKTQRVNAPHVHVYTRSLNDCAELFATFQESLGRCQYWPDGATEISDNRIFGMFHASTTKHNKELILNSLCQPKGIGVLSSPPLLLAWVLMSKTFHRLFTMVHHVA